MLLSLDPFDLILLMNFLYNNKQHNYLDLNLIFHQMILLHLHIFLDYIMLFLYLNMQKLIYHLIQLLLKINLLLYLNYLIELHNHLVLHMHLQLYHLLMLHFYMSLKLHYISLFYLNLKIF